MLRALLLGLMAASASAFMQPQLRLPGAGLAARSAFRTPLETRCSRVGGRVLGGLRAQEGQSPEDQEKSKALADAWIRNDKAAELKKLLGGSSLYVVGLPGCNNNKVGSMLAKRLETYSFLDLIEVMAAAVQKPECNTAPALIAEFGDKEFRDLEEAVLDQVQAVLRCVVAADGGVVLSAANWGRMQQGLVVFLDSDDATLSEKSGLGLPKIEHLRNEYQGFFDLADVKVTIDADDAIDTAAVKVIDGLLNTIKNNPPMRNKWQAEHDKRMAEEDAKDTKKGKGKPGEPPGKGFAPK